MVQGVGCRVWGVGFERDLVPMLSPATTRCKKKVHYLGQIIFFLDLVGGRSVTLISPAMYTKNVYYLGQIIFCHYLDLVHFCWLVAGQSRAPPGFSRGAITEIHILFEVEAPIAS